MSGNREDKVFYQQYTIVVVGILLTMVLFLLIARYFGNDSKAGVASVVRDVAEEIAPVAEVNVAKEERSAAAALSTDEAAIIASVVPQQAEAPASGEEVYKSICAACHSSPIPGIPQLADSAAWAPRVAKGKTILYQNAINGFQGESGMLMPGKGGIPTLSDAEVRAAVDYIVEKAEQQ